MGFDLEAMYRTHRRLVTWIVRASQVPSSAVEDVVQDVFITAHRRRANAPPGDLRRWLIGIAKGVSHSHRRHIARLRARDGAWLAVADAPQEVEREAQDRQELEIVLRAIDRLDEAKRDVFVLVVLHGLAPADVARLLGISRNAVYTRLHFARETLRDLPLSLRERARAEAEPSREQVQRSWIAVLAKTGVPASKLGVWGPAIMASVLVGAGVGASAGRPMRDPSPATSTRDAETFRPSAPASPSSAVAAASSRGSPVAKPTVAKRHRSAPSPRPRTPDTSRPSSRERQAEHADVSVTEEARLLRLATIAIDRGEAKEAARALDQYARIFPEANALREEYVRIRELHRLLERTHFHAKDPR